MIARQMSVPGQTRKSGDAIARSALPRSTDIVSLPRHVREMPNSDKGVLSGREACHQLEMSSGWVVNVKERASDDLALSKTYYTRVSGRQDAERAMAPLHAVEARLPVQASEFDALGIPVGGILPEIR
jgi:hypothetical protein